MVWWFFVCGFWFLLLADRWSLLFILEKVQSVQGKTAFRTDPNRVYPKLFYCRAFAYKPPLLPFPEDFNF